MMLVGDLNKGQILEMVCVHETNPKYVDAPSSYSGCACCVPMQHAAYSSLTPSNAFSPSALDVYFPKDFWVHEDHLTHCSGIAIF